MRAILVFGFLLFLNAQVYAQYTWEGKVLDSITGEPLSFVSVIINQSYTQGTRTDIDGKFSVILHEKTGTLSFSYVGYNDKTIQLSGSGKKNSVTVFLSPTKYQLNDVTIIAGENPANRIIKEVTKNADKNNPNKLQSYSYTSYDKFNLSGDVTDDYKLNKKDSSYTKELEFFKKYKLFILESVVKKQYKFPNIKKETVEGIKISGLEDPSFTLLMSQIQPTQFYDDFFSVMQKDFLNPISKGSTEKYFFNIEDTTYSGKDTVFIISYKPAHGKNFQGLKGLLYINTDGYAIEEVTAAPADSSGTLLYFNIEQKYSKVDSVHWFPVQINTRLYYNNFFREGLKVTMLGKSYLTDIKINSEIPNSVFNGIELELLPKAGIQPPSFWDANRHDSLSLKDKQSYALLDSIGKSHHLDAKVKVIESAANGELTVSWFNFILSDFIKLDQLEAVRLGFGARTNDRISRHFSLGGFWGYGIKDKVWKYGGNLSLNLYKKNNVTLNFVDSHDYVEAGKVSFYKEAFWGSGLNGRDYLVRNFDLIDEKSVSITGRTLKNLNFEVTGFQRYKHAQYPYEFATSISTDPVLGNSFYFTGATLSIRYSYNEKVIQSINQNWFVSTKFPIIWVNFTKGFSGIASGQFDYTKIDLKVSQTFLVKSIGKTSIQVQGGNVMGNLPYSELYTGRGNYSLIGAYTLNSFQTMHFNEFLSSRYIALFYSQNFGTLLFKSKRFEPRVIFATNAAIGSLNNISQHFDIGIKTLNKGYIESGLVFEDIFKKKIFGVARIGFGGGVFYRYGPYAFPKPIDNIAFKLDWAIEN